MKARLLRLLRLAERPEPPPGAGPTLEVFRASRRYFYLKATGWAARQLAALFGIFVSLVFLAAVEAGGAPESRRSREALERVFARVFDMERPELVFEYAGKVSGAFHILEAFAVSAFLIGLLLSWLALRLDWDARWYMVSDESLRIREGLFRTHERTMTVANIQNLTIRRGPLQRLLGIADLEVQTAGGGGGKRAGSDPDEVHKNLHLGRFRGIENAEALRARIEAAMRRQRDSGLGDPDEAHVHAAVEPVAALGTGAALVEAAAELRREAAGLRAAAEALSRG